MGVSPATARRRRTSVRSKSGAVRSGPSAESRGWRASDAAVRNSATGTRKPRGIAIVTFAPKVRRFSVVSIRNPNACADGPCNFDAVRIHFTAIGAGTTDILVSYTWRIAFQDSGQQFGLAAAISTVIFLIVAAITLLQMRFTRIAADEGRA